MRESIRIAVLAAAVLLLGAWGAVLNPGVAPLRSTAPLVQTPPPIISAIPWVLVPDTAVGDSLAIPRAFGGGARALDSIRKLAIAGTVPMNIWKVTEKVGDYDSGGTPGQECNRHIAGSFAWAVDQVAANPNAFNVIHFTSIHYIRCNDVLDNMPAMSHFIMSGTTAQGGVLFNTPRLRFNNTTRDCVMSNLTFRLSLTGTMTNENLGQCVYHQISTMWANGSGSGGQYTGFGSQTGVASGTNPQSHITNQLGLYAEGDESGPRLYAVGGGAPRMDCMVGSVGVTHHLGWRNFSAWGGRQPLIGCVGSPEGADPSINNNGALVAQSMVYGVVDRGALIQQEALIDLIGNWNVARPGIPSSLGRDSKVIFQEGCSDAGGSSPVGDTVCLQSVYGSQNRWTNPELPTDIQYGANDDGQWFGADSLFVCRDSDGSFGILVGLDSVNITNYCALSGNKVAQSIRRNNPQSNVVVGGSDYFYPDTTAMDSTRWENEFFRIVGDVYRVDFQGNPYLVRDSLDLEQLDWVRNHIYQTAGPKGYASNVLGVNILGSRQVVRPALPGGSPDTIHVRDDLFFPRDTSAYQPCTDADNDGMCVDAENLYAFLSDADATDRFEDQDGDGWTNYEELARGTNPGVYDGHDNPLESQVGPNTYGAPFNGRVHLGTYRPDTIVSPSRVDTFICNACVPYPESLNWISAQQAYRLVPLNDTTFLLHTKDTLGAGSYALQDSVTTDSICGANGITGCPASIREGSAGR